VRAAVDALEDMVREASELRRVPVLIATLPPQRAGGSRAGAGEYLQRFNDALKAMAAKRGAQVVDVNAQMPLTLIGEDGLHPTSAGYQRLAEIWLDALKARYEQAPQPAGLLHAPAGARRD
jgi:lysophospholipase L1-like esterase